MATINMESFKKPGLWRMCSFEICGILAFDFFSFDQVLSVTQPGQTALGGTYHGRDRMLRHRAAFGLMVGKQSSE
jgi:YD repeat-containing protein